MWCVLLIHVASVCFCVFANVVAATLVIIQLMMARAPVYEEDMASGLSVLCGLGGDCNVASSGRGCFRLSGSRAVIAQCAYHCLA